ncbi:SIR2 family protein [Sphingobacterium bovistauri]|uniref:SIR2 family protein n=1 Tax=Sphingobacterium bovistauri TaxID=2781959 RepID=A0ABS7Z450_9SPHI|nr:SIR2 family protein [Sphingobacterium bovistauri]MCA5004958.1 SIR2 family protein [Sphingobacterium bovistauri]
MNNYTHDPLRELIEIRNQLSYTKRLGFLFGAGTSKAMGISDITTLTKKIEDSISDPSKALFSKIKNDLNVDSQHIEAVLNQIRLIRQITKDSDEKKYNDIAGKIAQKLDKEICDKIYEIISSEEQVADIKTAKKFIGWLNWMSRDFVKEIFTTNYDLILEKSFEDLLIPFYDGFIGAHEPFFAHQTLDSRSKYDRPPTSWIRLWKLHGSLGWFWKLNEDKKTHRVIRLSSGAKEKHPDSELVIYPSRDKYESSRKQPFTSYFDRLKESLLAGEGIFIISGYSFSDEHVNEIIFSGLNQNNRLHIIAFFFDDVPLNNIIEQGKNFPNLTLMGPTQASISGVSGQWKHNKDGELLSPFWDKDSNKLKLGDFKELINFLVLSSGFRDKIENQTK